MSPRSASAGHGFVEATAKRLKEQGFTRPVCSNAEILALQETFPKEFLKVGTIAYYAGSRNRRAQYPQGYFFKSPRPAFSVEQILSAARLLWKQEKTGTLRVAIKKVLALEDHEIVTLLVADALRGGGIK